MLDDDYKLYCQQNVDLAKSIVIKCESAAKIININLSSMGENIDYDKPETWKYYLNLNGEYFVSNSVAYNNDDKMMHINTSEDGTLVEFTKANLALYSLTKASFKSYVNKLILDNPLQENLIYNIYRPIDINTAINAEDFQILRYDTSLVASNELSLMDKIQQWIYDFKDRYFKEDFQLSDPYYLQSFLGVMYINLPVAIMGFRHEVCGTPEVDQYHLWNYLNDHYELGSYKDALSTRQALWLYRNMVDVQRNAGKEWVLKELIDVLAKPKGLVANKFDFVKEESGNLLTGRGDGEFVKRVYDDNLIDLSRQPVEDPQTILYKTRDKASKNRKELSADQQELTTKGRYETKNLLPTGLIEFDLASTGIAELANDIQYRIEYWLYLSTLNMYNTNFTFDIPNSGKIVLSARDAFILYEYARWASRGEELDEIRPYYARNVVSFDPSISITDFRQHVPVEYVSDEFIQETLDDRIPNIAVTGPTTLERYAEAIIRRKLLHDISIDNLTELHSRAHHINVIEGVYVNYKCVLAPTGTSFNDWLSDKKIRKFSMTPADWESVMLDILFQCTGIDPENLGLGFSKRAMIEIIDRLTSYNLIVVDGSDGMLYENMPFPFIYPGKNSDEHNDEVRVSLDTRFIDLFAEQCSMTDIVEVDSSIISINTPTHEVFDFQVELPLDITLEIEQVQGDAVVIPSLNFIDDL